MKRGLNKEASLRCLYVLALLLMSFGMIAVSMLSLVSVSASQVSTSEQQPARPEFPTGEGRDTVLRLCSKCHSPTIVLAYGQKREGWENSITKMVGLGAKGSDEDFTDVADYLTANFPPSAIPKIFVNKATDQQIATILEISIDESKAIIAYRDKIGGFKSIEDLKKVPNVDTKKIDAKKDNLVF